jgi:hypothetical protein
LKRACLMSLLLLCVVSLSSANVLGVLPNVHGYLADAGVLVPFRGLAEWLGATVEFHSPDILLQQEGLTVKLTLGSKTARVNGRAVTLQAAPKAYGGITCVPLRFVAETFGVQATYHGLSMDMSRPMCGLPFVELQRGDNRAVVVVHNEAPNVVAAIIADLLPLTDGAYGERWIISIRRVGRDTVKVTGPVWYVESDGRFSPTEMSDCDLIRAGGHWRFTPEGGDSEG